jgi:phenol hydroxylase P0 protein
MPEKDSDSPSLEVTTKYVRVIEERPNGLVAFEFSIGWVDLSVELVLPRQAFDEFCVANQVVRIDA